MNGLECFDLPIFQGEMFGVDTHRRLFPKDLTHKSLCSASSICGRPVVYSAEAARYRSAMLCAPCNGEEENVLRSLAAGFGKRESAHESHMSLCDESHAS